MVNDKATFIEEVTACGRILRVVDAGYSFQTTTLCTLTNLCDKCQPNNLGHMMLEAATNVWDFGSSSWPSQLALNLCHAALLSVASYRAKREVREVLLDELAALTQITGGYPELEAP